MAYDKELAGRIRQVLGGEIGVVEKQMFGGVGFILNGNMACGVIDNELIVRVGPDAYADALLHPHVRPFDYSGRAMKGWVYVAEEGRQNESDLQVWVQRGLDFAGTLPPK